MTNTLAPSDIGGTADRNLQFRLYIVQGTPNSMHALANWERMVRRYLDGKVETEIVDVVTDPQRLLADGILVTPTLVRLRPEPIVRIVGDLNQTDRILQALGMSGET